MENKEQAILLAAEEEFLTKGFDGARTTRIAEKAGVTHAMLHYYFRTKKLLFERILQEKVDLIVGSINDFMLTEKFGPEMPDYETILRHIISSHFDLIAENRQLPRFMITEIMGNEEYMDMVLSRIDKKAGTIFPRFQKILDQAADEGKIEKTDARMLMLDIISLNLFVFIGMPFEKRIFKINDMDEFLEKRKQENIEVILRRIRKQTEN